MRVIDIQILLLFFGKNPIRNKKCYTFVSNKLIMEYKSRIVRKFLWFPKTILGDTRWLSIQTWEERAMIKHWSTGFMSGTYTRKFEPYVWID